MVTELPAPSVRVRPCDDRDLDDVESIINDAAEAYRGVIPPDRWKEPYMSRQELLHEIHSGVRFWGYEKHGFQRVTPAEKDRLLRKYWSIPDRQVETSVVLADATWRCAPAGGGH